MAFVKKELSKEIMVRSRLRNNFLKNSTEGNKIGYKTSKQMYVFFKKSYKKILRKLRWKKKLQIISSSGKL